MYHIRHRYFTMNNVVVGVALLIGASWAWGSIGVMQRNYDLQKEIDAKNRQLKLAELETQTLEYQQKYHRSGEYQELAVRERLTLVDPGEKVLILPPNSQAAKDTANASLSKRQTVTTQPLDGLQQWVNFLFGGNRRQ